MTPAQQLEAKLRTALAILEQGEPYAFQILGKHNAVPRWLDRKGEATLAEAIGYECEIRQIPLELLTPGDGRALHNPAGLSAKQVGEGYRLLLPEEVDGRYGIDGEGLVEIRFENRWEEQCDGNAPSETYRVPSTVPWPPHRWVAEMVAYESEPESVEFCTLRQSDDTFDGEWFGLSKYAIGRVVDIPWNDPHFKFRIAPKPVWTLPPPPEGRQWHRMDWTEEMLPEGWRPLLFDETQQKEDEWMIAEMIWDTLICHVSAPINEEHSHRRTRRPLPAPIVRIPLGPSDIKPGDVVRKKSWSESEWGYISTKALARKFARVSFAGDVHYTCLMDDYQIRSLGETEWREASKIKQD